MCVADINFLVCCLAVCSPSNRPARRDNTRGSWFQQHTPIIITWCRQFLSFSTNILLIKSNPKLESQSAWPCYHVILVASIAVTPIPGRERTHASFFFFFFLRQSVIIELHHSGVIAWRQRRRSRGVFKSSISVTLCPFQSQWRVLNTWYIAVLEQIGMSFNGIA